MYNVGDKVVYPMHGAGVIEAIEKKEILGEVAEYYVMRIPIGNMKVMIPTTSVDELGIREVTDERKINDCLADIKNRHIAEQKSWNRRYRENLAKIRGGDIRELAEVVYQLKNRERERGLSTGERKMLDNASQIFISEVILSKSISPAEGERLLERWLGEENEQIN